MKLTDRWWGSVRVRPQYEFLNFVRSTVYYQPRGENLRLMRLIDQIYLKYPFYGSRKMVQVLKRDGIIVNRKRIQRLMRLMGIEVIYQKPKISLGNPAHKKYPYLLRDVSITHCNQVWSTDITYIPMKRGFLYLVAVIDWFSRYVLSWELSNTLDVSFCLDALIDSWRFGKPEIFNTDQGSQFTSHDLTNAIKDQGVQMSMNGKGRAIDNIWIERLWRSVKYEEVYLKEYETGLQAHEDLDRYFHFYNEERPHQSLAYQTPQEIYFQQVSSIRS